MNINKAKETEEKSSLILLINQLLRIKNTCSKEMTNRFLWFYNGFLFHLSILIFLEWLSKPITLLCYMLLLAFLDLTASTFNSIPIILNIVSNRNVALIYSVTICQQKTKDCARSGSFEHNPQHRCFRLRCFITNLPYWLWSQWPALSMIFFK